VANAGEGDAALEGKRGGSGKDRKQKPKIKAAHAPRKERTLQSNPGESEHVPRK